MTHNLKPKLSTSQKLRLQSSTRPSEQTIEVDPQISLDLVEKCSELNVPLVNVTSFQQSACFIAESDSTSDDKEISDDQLVWSSSSSSNISMLMACDVASQNIINSSHLVKPGDIHLPSTYLTVLQNKCIHIFAHLENVQSQLSKARVQWNERLLTGVRQTIYMKRKLAQKFNKLRENLLDSRGFSDQIESELQSVKLNLIYSIEHIREDALTILNNLAYNEETWLNERAHLIKQIKESFDESKLITAAKVNRIPETVIDASKNYQSAAMLETMEVQEKHSGIRVSKPELIGPYKSICSRTGSFQSSVRSLAINETFSDITLEEKLQKKDRIILLQQKRLRELQRAYRKLRSTKGCNDQNAHSSSQVTWKAYTPWITVTLPLHPNDNETLEDLKPVSNGSVARASQVTFSTMVTAHPEHNNTRGSINNQSILCNQSNMLTSIEEKMFKEDKLCAISHHLSTSGLPNNLIEWQYLRHVLIKFLLSHERQAVQLLRVLSAVLQLTPDEEMLLRQNLESRSSLWPSRRHSHRDLPSYIIHGQFAKIIPP